MNPSLSRIEWALYVIAAAAILQSVMVVVATVMARRAWREASATFERQLAEIRASTDALAARVDRTADTVSRSAESAAEAIGDLRRGVTSATAWVDTFATAVTAPRSAAAAGLLKGYQWWRQRRRSAS